MFKFLLAFLIWLFATGKYSDWLALLTGTSTNGSENSGAAKSSTPDDLTNGYTNTAQDLSNIFGSLGGTSANTSASGTSTPDDLITGYTGQ